MITVLGGSGFIGSNLIAKLKLAGIPFYAPAKDEQLNGRSLGHIIYCIGLTADFRHKPFATVDAHVCVLNKILEKENFESLTYLSSTRVYVNSNESEVFENTPITVSINDADELYTLTKLTGERLCLSSGKNTKIVRLSNVYGFGDMSENFITGIIKSIRADGFLRFFTTPASAKDYISIDPLCDLLIMIATKGTQSVYNLASGENISNEDIIEMLKQHYSFEYEFDKDAKEIIFPKINIDRIKNEFNFSTSDNKKNLSRLIKMYNNDKN
jgi:nucleoside-diphosphate-sugar epimerase